MSDLTAAVARNFEEAPHQMPKDRSDELPATERGEPHHDGGVKKGYDPEEARDDAGKWTTGGDIGSAAITDEQRTALGEYAGNSQSFEMINPYLRGEIEPEALEGSYRAELDGTIAKIDEAIAGQQTDREQTVYRVMENVPYDQLKAQQGKVMTFAGYTSTTTDYQYARSSLKRMGDDKVLLNIKVPAGSQALDVNLAMGEDVVIEGSNEHELLIGRGSSFRVDDVRQTSGTKYKVTTATLTLLQKGQ